MVIASYAASKRGLLLYLAISGPVGALVIGPLVLLPLAGAAGPLLFVVWLGIGAFYAYYFGFRQICLVELTPAELRWRHAIGGAAAPLGDVRSIRCSQVSGRRGSVDVATVEFTSRRSVRFSARTPGLTEFLAKVRDAAPQVSVAPPGA